MKIVKLKCYMCDGITDKVKIAHDYQGGDYLMCPLCGAILSGFSEVGEEDVKECSRHL